MSFNENNESDIFDDMCDFFDEKIEEQGGFVAQKVEDINKEVVGGKSFNEANPLREKFFNKLIELNYNLDELKDFLDCENNMLVLSCAGAGKTTGLIFKIIYDLLSGNTMKTVQVPNGTGGYNNVVVPCNILVSTFLKTGAEELEKEFKRWCEKLNIVGLNYNCVKFRTLHAEVYDAIKSMGYPLNISTDTNALLKASMMSLNIRSVMSHSQNITIDEINDVAGICTYARNRLDERRYEHSLMSDYALGRFELDLLLQDFKTRRQSARVVDFEDLQEILYDGLQQNENVRQFIANRYDCIYIDEFQDTSQLQYEILKYYSVGCRKVVAIGDDDQCLVEGTLIDTPEGLKNIEDIQVGDKVLSNNGYNQLVYTWVDKVWKHHIKDSVYEVVTKSGKSFKATGEHIGFTVATPTQNKVKDGVINATLTMFGARDIYGVEKELYAFNINKPTLSLELANCDSKVMSDIKYLIYRLGLNHDDAKVDIEILEDAIVLTYRSEDDLKRLAERLEERLSWRDLKLDLTCNAKLGGSWYNLTFVKDIKVGDFVPVQDGCNNTCIEEVVNINTIPYEGYVYDLSVPKTRNFVANGIVVHNCIYSWRGSDIDIISSIFERDFKPEIRKLTVNYRCASNILEAVVPSIVKNTKRHEKSIKAFKQGGELKIIKDSNVNYLLDSIKDDLTRFETLGVLARTNADLLIPAILLELDGNVNFSVSKAVSIDGRLPRQVLDLMDLILKRHTEKFEGMFKMFLSKYDQYQASKLDNILRINKQYNLFNIPEKDITYSVPKLAPVILGLRKAVAKDQVFGYIYLLELLKAQVYTGQSVYAQKARLFTDFIKKLIVEHKDLKNLSLYELDMLFNDVLREKLNKRASLGKNARIKLTTIHEAKGKEWDSVYIWNDIDGCFPNSVGNRDLTLYEYEEERRVHYIAWTRAKKKLTVFTASDRMGDFLKECDLSNDGVILESKSDIEKNAKIVHKKPVELPKELQDKAIDSVTTEKVLRDYIDKPKNDMQELSNMEIVLSQYSISDLVDMLDKNGTLTNSPEQYWDEKIVELFDELSDLLYEATGIVEY